MTDYRKTIIDFLSQKREKNVIGIMLINSNYNISNNVELLVIKSTVDKQESGCKDINGIMVNYLIDDLTNLQEIIKRESYTGTLNYQTKVLNSILVFDKQGEIKEFINHVKNLNNQIAKNHASGNDINSFILINKRMNDLFELINTEYFYYIYYNILERIKFIYMRMSGIKNSKEGLKRLTKNPLRDKRILDNEIKLMHDPNFEEKYKKCIELSEANTMFDNLKTLYYYCFGNIEKELLENAKDINIISLKRM